MSDNTYKPAALLYQGQVSELASLSARLGDVGYAMVPVSSLEEAKQALDKQHIALAFVDVSSESPEGLEVIRVSRALDPDMPILVLSSNDELGIRAEARSAGANDYLATPVQDIDLELRVAQLQDARGLKRLLRTHSGGPLVLAGLDVLTGLPGAGALQDHLDREYARARRYGHVLTVLMLGMDRLGSYNNKYGHEAGDRAVRLLADVLRSALRSPDIVARHSGDHFVVLASDTNQEQGVLLGNRLRAALRVESRHASLPGLTVSIGVASTKAVQVSRALDLLGAAERALALAKSEGRDCCHAETKR